MPDNEWARLTPGEAGDNAAWYRRLDSRHHHRPHCFEFGPSEHAPRPWNKGHRMSAAELAAIPAVAALVEAAHAARSVLEHEVPYGCWSTGPITGDPIVDSVACHACGAIAQIDTALAALDPTTPEEDDARH